MNRGRPKIKCIVCSGRIPSKRVWQRKETCGASCSAKIRWKKKHIAQSKARIEQEAKESFWAKLAFWRNREEVKA